jgi:hypothetical protein
MAFDAAMARFDSTSLHRVPGTIELHRLTAIFEGRDNPSLYLHALNLRWQQGNPTLHTFASE